MTNPDLITRLAREAGFDDAMEGRGIWTGEDGALRRFAALVAEECARAAESSHSREHAAAAIRAKFKEPK
jgi:hypothetical protein